MEGVWEFPGGKCEPGETSEQATARECLEEVGVAVKVERLRARIVHRYGHGLVELSFYDCVMTDPAAEPAEGSGFRWSRRGDLTGYTFPGANEPVVAALARDMGEVRPTD